MKKGKSNKWQEALDDARRKLADGRLYVAKMKAAVKKLEEMAASDEAWPGDKAA